MTNPSASSTGNSQIAKNHCVAGEALLKQGKNQEGEVELRRALEYDPKLVPALANLAKLHRDRGELDATITLCREAIEVDPSCNWAHANLGWSLDKLGDLDAAEAAYRESLRIKPDDRVYHNNLGLILQRKQLYAEAIEEYEKALQIDSGYEKARNNLAWSQKAKDRQARRDRLESSGGTASEYASLAEEFCKAKEYDLGMELAREAIRHDPNLPEAHYWQGYALYHTDREDRGLAEFEEAVRLNPGYAKAHQGIADVYFFKLDRPQDAIEPYRQAIACGKGSAWLRVQLGLSLYKSDRREEAIEQYLAVIKADPKYTEGHHFYGDALWDKNERDQAVAEWLEALRLGYRDPHIFNDLGNYHTGKRHWDQAVYYYNESLKINQNDFGAHNGLGIMFMRKKEYEKALQEFNQAKQADPKAIDGYVGVSWALREANRLDQAIATSKSTLETFPDNVRALLDYAVNISVKAEKNRDSGGLKNAEGIIDQALAVEPENLQALLLKAVIARKLKDKSSAIKCLKLCLEADPGYGPAHMQLSRWLLKSFHFRSAIDHIKQAIPWLYKHADTLD